MVLSIPISVTFIVLFRYNFSFNWDFHKWRHTNLDVFESLLPSVSYAFCTCLVKCPYPLPPICITSFMSAPIQKGFGNRGLNFGEHFGQQLRKYLVCQNITLLHAICKFLATLNQKSLANCASRCAVAFWNLKFFQFFKFGCFKSFLKYLNVLNVSFFFEIFRIRSSSKKFLCYRSTVAQMAAR